MEKLLKAQAEFNKALEELLVTVDSILKGRGVQS